MLCQLLYCVFVRVSLMSDLVDDCAVFMSHNVVILAMLFNNVIKARGLTSHEK